MVESGSQLKESESDVIRDSIHVDCALPANIESGSISSCSRHDENGSAATRGFPYLCCWFCLAAKRKRHELESKINAGHSDKSLTSLVLEKHLDLAWSDVQLLSYRFSDCCRGKVSL